MTKCRSCEAPVVWATSTTGKATPMQVDPAGAWIIVDGRARLKKDGDEGPFYTSHFATCPQASSWRGKK